MSARIRRRRMPSDVRIRARPPPVRACGGRADAARRLSRRPHAACLADRRAAAASARRRSPIAWRASCWRIPIPSSPAVQRARNRSRSSPSIRSRGASRRRRIPTCWCSSAPSTKTASCARIIAVDDVRRTRRRSSARPRARAAGASASSTRSTSSMPQARTRCSRCWRSRRRARCSCWSAMRRAGCCRPSARAAGG